MKFKFLYTLFALAGLCFLFISNSNGPGEVQGLDRTGSPLSPGPCQACHSAGAFSPGIEVNVLEGDNPVSSYVPGESYTLRVKANHTGSPAGYGFQAVALQADDDSQAGNFSNPSTDVQITTLNGRQYPEHNKRSNNDTFEVDWEAPVEGTGDVNFYSSIVVANGSGGNAGDGSVFLNTPLTLSEAVVSTNKDNSLLESLRIFPNPVQDELNLLINSREQAQYQFFVTNLAGQVVFSRQISLGAGEQNRTFGRSPTE